MTALAIMAGVIGVAASIDDLSRRQISNWIPWSAFAGGVVLQTVQHGWRGAGSALAGAWRARACSWFFICSAAWAAET